MFLHQHPYPPFIPANATKLIVGTIPPPRFSTGNLYQEDVDFCYGSKHGLLWPILNEIFDLGLVYENTNEAIHQRKSFLTGLGIGICDMVESCSRNKIDASDLGMLEVTLRDLTDILNENKSVNTLLLMGGNSKNGPEYFLRSHLRSKGITMTKISLERPRIHEFTMDNRTISVISLISPSSAANRSIGSDPLYKAQKALRKNYSTLDYRIQQYQNFFY